MGDQEEKWPELSSMLGELGSKLDRLIDAGMEKALPDYADGIVLSATAQTVQLHEGYRYNYLVVSSDAATAMGSSNTLTIDTPGIKYTQPIYEGINPLNIKGSTAKLSVSGLSGDYAAQFVETNESPLVRSAGSVKLAGTGSVQLTGSLAPLDDTGAVLIATIPYSDFVTASASIYPSINGKLTPKARHRALTLKSSLNETATLVSIALFDSSIGGSGVLQPGAAAPNTAIASQVMIDSNTYASIGALGDSMILDLSMGATLPTSGTIEVYCRELI